MAQLEASGSGADAYQAEGDIGMVVETRVSKYMFRTMEEMTFRACSESILAQLK